MSPDGTLVYDCAAGRLQATTLATLSTRDLGPCPHGRIVANDDPQFVVVLAGSTVHVVRADGARIDVMSFAQDARLVTLVRDAASGRFELLGDPPLVGSIGYRPEGSMYTAHIEDASSSRWNTPGLLRRFFSGAPREPGAEADQAR